MLFLWRHKIDDFLRAYVARTSALCALVVQGVCNIIAICLCGGFAFAATKLAISNSNWRAGAAGLRVL
ncbi:conserved protein of unknown function [Ectopseudomonas oleovorans]|uniref:Uncharacterized protein n=1 Tax=Ectopseudomonas oleovorans TaxID=301 RepID=A0A653AYM9_ECTOL|nr:conserved protein of unknown function [Pseudomonas oleovorans]